MDKFLTRHFAEILSTTEGREQILEPVVRRDIDEIDLSQYPGAYYIRFLDRREIRDEEGLLLTSEYFNESYPVIIGEKVLKGAEVRQEASNLSNAKLHQCLTEPDQMWVKFREGEYAMIAPGITVIDGQKNQLWHEPLNPGGPLDLD
jgi:hypothetical protein